MRDEAEDERAGGGDEEGGESGDEARFGLGEAVAVFCGAALGGEVGDEVCVDLGMLVSSAIEVENYVDLRNPRKNRRHHPC